MSRLLDTRDIANARDTLALLRNDRATITARSLVAQSDGTTLPTAGAVTSDVPCRVDPLDQRARRMFGDSELLDQASHALSFATTVTIAAGATVTVGSRSFTVVGTDADRTNAFQLTVLAKETGATG